MKGVLIATMLYSLLFVVLTIPDDVAWGSFSVEMSGYLHHFLSECFFWAATLYICISATYGAFARQDRFALSQEHPLINRMLSVMLLISPFLAIFYNARFVYLLLGLLLFSQLRSQTEDEKSIEFSKSRALSNMLLIPLFTLALMLMNNNDYNVSSVLNFESTLSSEQVTKGEEE